MTLGTRLGRLVVLLVGFSIALLAGWMLFLRYPTSVTDLLGILLAIATVILGLRFASRVATRVFPDYTVAEVAVEEFTLERSLTERLRVGASVMAFAFGAGITAVFDDDGFSLRE